MAEWRSTCMGQSTTGAFRLMTWLLSDRGVEAFPEPAANGCEQLAGPRALPALGPEAGKAHRSAQLQ